MPHPLEQKIATLRRRVRRTTAVYGLSIATAVLLATTAALGLGDYLLRFQDRGLRIIASLLALSMLGWTFYRYVLAAWLARLGDLDLALLVQRRFPSLGDRLLSAVEFLHADGDDPAAGSTALRQAMVAATTAEAEPLDFSAVLNRRSATWAAAALAAVCLLTGVCVLMDPSGARIAATRLANPFGTTAWPRMTHLAIRRPVVRVARGRAFQLEVVDAQGARLPSEVRIHYRFDAAEAEAVEEVDRLRYAGGAMTARRENVLRPFSYWIEGGDDQSLPWYDVQVVEPPAIEVATARLIPPAYTGWPPVAAQRNIRALEGTRVEITATTTKPLQSAVLCLESGARVPAQLDANGKRLSVAFTVEKSGSYWFDLTDREGLTGGSDDRWEIRAIHDPPPTVTIEQPTANLFVTPRAVVPLRVAAKDNLAIRSMALMFRRSDSEPEAARPLWTSAATARPEQPPEDQEMPEGDRRVVEDRWDLGPLGLKPGARVTFYATATDYQPQTGKSEPRSLTIITAEELQNRLAEHEKLVLAELRRVLQMERGCRAQLESLGARLAQRRPIGQPDVDLLQALQHNQREVDRALSSRGEGVPMHVLALLADLENNRVAGEDIRQRMAALLDQLERLSREHLSPLGQELTAAAKTAQAAREDSSVSPLPQAGEGQGGRAERRVSPLPLGEGPGVRAAETANPAQPALTPNPSPKGRGDQIAGLSANSEPVAVPLVAAGQHQDAVIAALEQMIGQLGQWDSYRRFVSELGQVARDQQALVQRTAEVGRRTLTQALRDLAPADAEELQTVADRQLDLARLLDHLLRDMDQAGGALRQNDPTAARTIADAVDQLRRRATGQRMRTAGEQIQQNQIGQAASEQKQIGQSLQDILDLLGQGRRPATTEPTGEEIARLEGDVEQLRARQQKARQETQRLDELLRPPHQSTRMEALALRELAKQQHAAAADAARLGERFATGSPPGNAMTAAAREMNAAGALLDGRTTGQATQQAQQNAIGQLDALLTAMKTTKSATAAAGQLPSSASPSPAAGTRKKPDAARDQTAMAQPGASPSQPAAGDGKSRKAAREEARAAIKRLWGSLPERARQQMLEAPVEEFPPKYEEQIEQYFRRLAEEKGK